MNLRALHCRLAARLVRARWLIALAFSVLSLCGFLSAQQDERAVRAAFVFNLTKYVSWPGSRDRLVIGVIGSNNMASVLKQVLDGKVSDGRPITVVLHKPEADVNECDVLYIAGMSPDATRSALDRVRGRAVLTVGDSEQFVRAGGMVALVRSGDQIEIEVNLPELRSRRLDMSSRLLKLAVLVPRGGGAQ